MIAASLLTWADCAEYGVRSAMPCRTAQRLCPDAIFLPPRFDVYKAISQQIMAIFRSHTHLVEPVSLDEAYLDVSAVVHDLEEATQLAQTIKHQIREATALTASAGVSFCKSLAKAASDAHKPDGLTVISLQQAPAFLDAMPIEHFLGVGKVTAAKLRQAGIERGADLKRLGEERLHALLGNQGNALYQLACAKDDRPVEPSRERKSVGKETTFERDLTDRARMEEILAHLAMQVEQRLVELALQGKTLTLKVRWSNFQVVTRSVSRAQGFQDAQTMTPVLYTLLHQLDGKSRPVRLLGVAVSKFLTQEEMRRNEQIVALRLWDAE